MNDAPVENGFFRWVRELKIYRGTDSWIGGVASGIAQRFDLSPILVRGIFVALTCLAGLGLLVYGIAWALLPDSRGTIHAQQAIAGNWSSGMSGALVAFIFGSIGFPAFFSWWDGGFWSFLVIAGILFLIFSRRGRFAEAGRQDPTRENIWNTEQDTKTWPDQGAASNFPSAASYTQPAAPYTAASDTPGSGAATTQTNDPTPHTEDAGRTDSPAVDFGTEFLPFSADFAQSNAPAPNPPASNASAATSTTQQREATAALPENNDDAQNTTENSSAQNGPRVTEFSPAARFQSLDQEHAMPFTPPNPPREPRISATVPPYGSPAEDSTATAFMGTVPPPAPGSSTKVYHNQALPGYAATIILGLAILVFALIVGLHQLNMLDLPTSAVAIGLAATLVIIALGIIGAAVNQRTGGALIGFGIAALVLSLIFSGGALRTTNLSMFSNGITTVDESGTTNVFHSGTMDLLHYSTITQDTTVSVDNVFTSLTMIVPDNIPVILQSDGAFSSLKINGSSSSISGGSTRINPSASGPTLYLDLDGAFTSVEISVQKAEVAP